MNSRPRTARRGLLAVVVLAALQSPAFAQDFGRPDRRRLRFDPSGVLRTVATNGSTLDRPNPFFQSLGSERAVVRLVPRRVDRVDDLPGRTEAPVRPDRRSRPDLPHGRRLELAPRRRLDP